MDIEIKTQLELSNTKPDYSIQYLTANLSYVPIVSNHQHILSINTNPKSIEEGQNLVFNIDNPNLGKIPISVNAQVKAVNRFTPITEKVAYPLKNIPSANCA